MIKVGIIGYGYSARTFHIPLIESTVGMQLTAISSSKPDIVKADNPSVTVFDTAQALIASKTINLAVITVPNHIHFPLTNMTLVTNY